MKPEDALEFLCEVSPHNDQTEAACDALYALLRRDWAVRVLDAHLATGGDVDLAQLAEDSSETDEWDLELRDAEGQVTHAFTEPTAHAARHAAAEAVLPTLSDATRAELGGCP